MQLFNGRLNRFLKTLTVLVLSLTLMFSAAMGVSAKTLTELREDREGLQVQKDENSRKLQELENVTEDKKIYRDALNAQIEVVQGQLDDLKQQIEALNEKISQEEDRLSEKQKAVDKNMELFRARVRALYETGEATTTFLVLDSKNIMDLSEKAVYLKALSQHDRDLIDTLTAQLKEIEDDIAVIDADKAKLDKSKETLEERTLRLNALYKEAEEEIAVAQEQEEAALLQSQQIQAALDENEEAIAQLEEELRRNAISTGTYEGTGSFIWPAPGYTYLTCYFGEGGHRGIDIAGGDIYGEPIIAADSGIVQYAGWNDSYGYCVFIDHGNGYQTRYAHMSELNTVTGAVVDQSQIIGYVGSTGNSTGPHLHFEVIYQDSLTNPMGYF